MRYPEVSLKTVWPWSSKYPTETSAEMHTPSDYCSRTGNVRPQLKKQGIGTSFAESTVLPHSKNPMLDHGWERQSWLKSHCQASRVSPAYSSTVWPSPVCLLPRSFYRVCHLSTTSAVTSNRASPFLEWMAVSCLCLNLSSVTTCSTLWKDQHIRR